MICHPSLGAAIIHALMMIKGVGVAHAPTPESHLWKIYRCSGDTWSQVRGNKQAINLVNRSGLYSYQNYRLIFYPRSEL